MTKGKHADPECDSAINDRSINDLCSLIYDKKAKVKRSQKQARDQRNELKATEARLAKALKAYDRESWTVQIDDSDVTFELASVVSCIKGSRSFTHSVHHDTASQEESLDGSE